MRQRKDLAYYFYYGLFGVLFLGPCVLYFLTLGIYLGLNLFWGPEAAKEFAGGMKRIVQ